MREEIYRAMAYSWARVKLYLTGQVPLSKVDMLAQFAELEDPYTVLSVETDGISVMVPNERQLLEWTTEHPFHTDLVRRYVSLGTFRESNLTSVTPFQENEPPTGVNWLDDLCAAHGKGRKK